MLTRSDLDFILDCPYEAFCSDGRDYTKNLMAEKGRETEEDALRLLEQEKERHGWMEIRDCRRSMLDAEFGVDFAIVMDPEHVLLVGVKRDETLKFDRAGFIIELGRIYDDGKRHTGWSLSKTKCSCDVILWGVPERKEFWLMKARDYKSGLAKFRADYPIPRVTELVTDRDEEEEPQTRTYYTRMPRRYVPSVQRFSVPPKVALPC